MSELITPEEFINDKEFVKALKTINASLADLLKTFDALSTSVKGYYTEVNKGAKSNADLVKNQNLVSKSTKELTEAEKELERLRKDTAKTIAKQAALKSQEYKDNVKAREELKKQKAAIHDVDGAEAKRRGNIGRYKEDIVKAYLAIKGAIMAASGVTQFFDKVIKSTNATAEEFEFQMAAVKGALDGALRSMANGDWKNFFTNMKEGAYNARQLAEAMDLYNDVILANKILTADELDRMNELQAIYKLTTNSIKVRTDALNEYEKIAKNAAKRNLDAEKGINDSLVEEIANRTKLTSDQIKQSVTIYGEHKKAFKNTEEIVALEKKLVYEQNEGLKGAEKRTQKKLDGLNRENELLLENTDITTAQIRQLLIVHKLMSPEEINKLGESYIKLAAAKSESTAVDKELARVKGTLGKGEGKLGDSVEKAEEEESKKTLARFEYTWKQKEKIQEDSLKRQWDAAEEALKVEYAGREVELADFKDKEKQKAEAVEEAEKQKQAAIEQSRQLAQESMNLLFDIGITFGDRKIASIEEEAQREIDAIDGKQKALTAAERKKQKIEEESAKKIGAIKKKQWIADKIAALSNIWINFAIAKSKGFAQAGPVLGIPLAAWMTIQSVLQTALVLSQPIPKFFKGVNKIAKDTFGIVGDNAPGKTGDSFELVETPKNGMFLTPNKATEMLIPKGSTIHSHEKTIEKLKEMNPESMDKLLKEQQLTRKAIANQVHNSTHVTEDGLLLVTKRGSSYTKHIDTYYRK